MSECPNIFFSNDDIKNLQPNYNYAKNSNIKIDAIQASFGLALHMHQPTIPAGANGALISNLQHMMEYPDIGDNHNASVFLQCYQRMADFIPDLVARGKNPRIMLDYSGNLLWGLAQKHPDAIQKLKKITCDKKYIPYAEWLGTMWSHAVATSTPIPDLKLHIMAWRKYFADIFGEDACRRVKGFSPPEMHLPIHPDQCYEYIKALKECGYEWLMVQEHTVENMDGSGIQRPHLPHRLMAKNSKGEVQEIVVLIKTQGSDTKLVAQMQPYHEAMSRQREDYAGQKLPLFVCQIGDGENGGVMMNEFPRDYNKEFEHIGITGTTALNGSEYLDLLYAEGVKSDDFIPIQPISQHRIWSEIGEIFSSNAADEAIERIKQQDQGFNLDRASWTSDRNWVEGYGDVLDPINTLSAKYHQKYDKVEQFTHDDHKNAFLYLLISQTSCFRYWGQGAWTEYAKELCRRGVEFCSE